MFVFLSDLTEEIDVNYVQRPIISKVIKVKFNSLHFEQL